MSLWQPVAILPNFELEGQTAIDVPHMAFASVEDPRVQEFNAAVPKHRALLERLRDPFGDQRSPTILLVSPAAPPGFRTIEAMASIRNILSVAVIPLARARHRPGQSLGPLPYSDVFEFYPWAINSESDGIYMVTPGTRGMDDAEGLDKLNVQTAPEIGSQCGVDRQDIDVPVLDALTAHWTRVCRSRRKRAHANDKVLRSLNMAYHASKLPALQDAGIFDYGRLVALWVSAFEILAHPGEGSVNRWAVYALLEGAEWRNRSNQERRFLLRERKGYSRRIRPCRVYERLYRLRNDFIHGNPFDQMSHVFRTDGVLLHKAAAPLYRMALAGLLRVRLAKEEPEDLMEYVKYHFLTVEPFYKPQGEIEEAIAQALPPRVR
ncbi:MAG: hypothetical protein F4Y71_09120 [Acidobacteria bacterium]|nr:hypothetical protein [Acidobacteriota bacterium]MYG74639.1 hypothetical protein [Acidobacteriota bacterium]